MSQINGRISQIIGPVIDVYFDTKGENPEKVLPKIHDALRVKRANGQDLIIRTDCLRQWNINHLIVSNTNNDVALTLKDSLIHSSTLRALRDNHNTTSLRLTNTTFHEACQLVYTS